MVPAAPLFRMIRSCVILPGLMDSVPSVRGESSALELLRTLQKNEETGRFFAGLQAVYANLQAASQVTVL